MKLINGGSTTVSIGAPTATDTVLTLLAAARSSPTAAAAEAPAAISAALPRSGNSRIGPESSFPVEPDALIDARLADKLEEEGEGEGQRRTRRGRGGG